MKESVKIISSDVAAEVFSDWIPDDRVGNDPGPIWKYPH